MVSNDPPQKSGLIFSFLWVFKFWKSINPIKSYDNFCLKNKNHCVKNENFVLKMTILVIKIIIFVLKMTIFLVKKDLLYRQYVNWFFDILYCIENLKPIPSPRQHPSQFKKKPQFFVQKWQLLNIKWHLLVLLFFHTSFSCFTRVFLV